MRVENGGEKEESLSPRNAVYRARTAVVVTPVDRIQLFLIQLISRLLADT